MDIDLVMDGVHSLLHRVPKLRVFEWPAASVAPPAVVVSYPDAYDFGGGTSYGLDRIELPIVLVVGKPSERSARDLLTSYCGRTGAYSIKEHLESAKPYTNFDTLRLTRWSFDVITIGTTDYMAAIGTADITGSGA